jgi:hemolysin III
MVAMMTAKGSARRDKDMGSEDGEWLSKKVVTKISVNRKTTARYRQIPSRVARRRTELAGLMPLPKLDRQEWANALTHAIGVLLSGGGAVVLVGVAARFGDPWQITSASVYSATLIMLYASSTIYHVSNRKPALQKFDHAAIFLLIAGSYTPFVLVTLRGPWGWSLFGVVWGMAVVGVCLKFWYAGRFRVVSTLIYLGMGWLVLIAIKPLWGALPAGGMRWLLAGGACYSVGCVFYLWKQLPYQHAIWHGWVMAGSVCHWIAVYGYVIDRV